MIIKTGKEREYTSDSGYLFANGMFFKSVILSPNSDISTYTEKSAEEFAEYIAYQADEQQGYTAEQLEQMTNVELREICSELGISGSMTKANMIALILDKQNNIA